VDKAYYSPLHKAWLVGGTCRSTGLVYASGKTKGEAEAKAKARREEEKKAWGIAQWNGKE
jgi:hypothetical protein